VFIKGLVLWVLATMRGLPSGERLTFVVLLAQGGEFAFVLLLTYGSLGLVTDAQSTLVTAVVSLSMLATPLLLILADRVIRPRFIGQTDNREMAVENEGADVIIAGFGRFGQIVGRVLLTQGIRATVLDHDPEHIDFVNRFGSKVFYGDATRLDLLEAAGASTAKVLVISIDDEKKSVLLAKEARRHFPNIKILARARNRPHAYELVAAGVDEFWRETFDSSAMLAARALEALGKSRENAEAVVEKFVEHDRKVLMEAVDLRGDQDALRAHALRSREELEQLFEGDVASSTD
jgi:voltage-gated potassium channel Kch